MESTELKKKTRTSVILRKDHEAPKPNDPKMKMDRIERAAVKAMRFSKLTDAVAESDHWSRNEPIPYGKELFPEEWRCRYADLFYPLAKGGPIYFDLPMAPYDIDLCKKKMAAFHAKGVRYAYVLPNEGETELLMRLDGASERKVEA